MTRFFSILVFLFAGALRVTGAEYEVRIGGTQQTVETFTHYHYVTCSPTAPAECVVTTQTPVASAEVSPLSRNIQTEVEGRTIRFTIPGEGYYLVRINETERLFIFAEKPEQKPAGVDITSCKGVVADGRQNITQAVQAAIDACAKQGRTLVFPAGEYLCGQLRLPSNAHLHLQRGAVLRADATSTAPFESTDNMKTRRFIYIKDARNVRITGLGAIDGNGRALRDRFADKARMRLLLAVNSQQLLVEGVMLRDPGSWNTQILLCRDVTIRHVKLMNDTELSNTDGFDPDATRNMLIENCFAYCSDDNVAIKTTGYSDYLGDVENITVRGCVFLTKKSSLKVGTETRGARMSGITFEDNDVVESDRGMALYVSDGTDLSNVRYLNNRFERNHPDSKQMMFHFVVDARKEGTPLGSIRDVVVKDCSFRSNFPKGAEIKSQAKKGIEASFVNLTVAGEKVLSPEQIGLKVINANVSFE